MRNQAEIIALLNEHEVVITDSHFVYTKGHHGPDYVSKEVIYLFPELMFDLCADMAQLLKRKEEVDMVIAPATAGIGFAPMMATAIGDFTERPVPMSGWADKDGSDFVVMRIFRKAIQGKRVLIVEDVINSASTCTKTVKAIRNCGGIPVCVVAVWNRSPARQVEVVRSSSPEGTGINIPIRSLVEKELPKYDPDDCPLCKARVPMRIDLGHGAKWCENFPEYPIVPYEN